MTLYEKAWAAGRAAAEHYRNIERQPVASLLIHLPPYGLTRVLAGTDLDDDPADGQVDLVWRGFNGGVLEEPA